ncbi:hypothetical protein C8J56DRAFT_789741, partial [Mycena floridula]
VRRLLHFPGPNPLGPSPAPVKKTVAPPKKPDGISRELFALNGPSPDSTVPGHSALKAKIKAKPNLRSGAGKVKWECRPFKNSPRTDSLQLSHWVKASSDPNAVYTYPHDEYRRLIQGWIQAFPQGASTEISRDSEGWTKEETDYLVYQISLKTNPYKMYRSTALA